MKEISIIDFLKLCRNHIVMLILMPIVVVFLVYIVNNFLVPIKFETETQLLVSPKNELDVQSLDTLRSSIQLMGTLSSVVQSDKTLIKVAEELKLNKIDEKISVQTEDNSLIMTIKVVGENKIETLSVANKISEIASNEFPLLFKGTAVTVLKKANEPKNPSIIFQLILAIVTGELAALSFLVLLSLSSSIVVKGSQLEELGLITLGVVPLVKKNEI